MSQWTFGQSGRKVDAIQVKDFDELNKWVIGKKSRSSISSLGDLIKFGDYLVYHNDEFYIIKKDFFEKHYEIK